VNRTRYKFLGRAGDTYVWRSVHTFNGDHVKIVTANVVRFWNGENG
jgi:hypothetical protein